MSSLISISLLWWSCYTDLLQTQKPKDNIDDSSHLAVRKCFFHWSFLFLSSCSHSSVSSIPGIQALQCLCAKLDPGPTASLENSLQEPGSRAFKAGMCKNSLPSKHGGQLCIKTDGAESSWWNLRGPKPGRDPGG